MARGKKNYTLSEQLEMTNTEIVETEDKLKELKERKTDLEKQIEQQEITELYSVVKQSGKTIDEIKAILAE